MHELTRAFAGALQFLKARSFRLCLCTCLLLDLLHGRRGGLILAAQDSGAATVRSEDVKWRFDVFAGLIDDFVNLYTHPVDPDLLQRLAAARMSAGPPPPGVSSRQAVAYENARWHLDRLEAQYKQHVAHAVVGYQQQLRGARQRYLVENKVRWRDLSPDRQVGLIERAQELLFETCKVHVDAQHEKRQQWPDPSSLVRCLAPFPGLRRCDADASTAGAQINELFSALESEIRAAQGRYEECLANARSGVDSFSRVGAPAGAVANLDVLLVPLRNEDSARRFMLLTKRQQAQAVMGCTAAVVFVTLCVRERHELPSAHEVVRARPVSRTVPSVS